MVSKIYPLIISMLFINGITVKSQNLQNFSVSSQKTRTSVLSFGNWYKIKIYQEGIYKLTYDDIKNLGFSDPSAIKIFGNGGAMLPLMNSVPRANDLLENAIYVFKGTDDEFNQGDYILFYGKGPVSWTYNPSTEIFEHKINQYSDAAYYFITPDAGEGKRVQSVQAISGTPDKTSNSFNDYAFHERNRYNLIKSGRLWLGERIDLGSYDTTFSFSGIISTEPVILQTNVVGRSSGIKTFTFRNNEKVIGSIQIPGVTLTNKNGICANQKSGRYSFSAPGDQININVGYNKGDSNDEGFLDYITLNVRRKLVLTGDVLFFRDPSVIGNDSLVKYLIENCNNTTEVWDVTDFTNIRKMSTQLNGTQLTFQDNADSLKEYLALNPAGNFPKPIITSTFGDLGIVSNQNLHAIDPVQMLIISHPLFREAADSLALFHQLNDNISVQVVNTDQIYNEFSSGAYDVSAIRDFTRMIYDRATDDNNRLKYLLLVGDGSYNNISRSAGNPNFIPTYQSESSLNESTSYVTDDFFGILENEEGGFDGMHSFTLDVGVGRLPVKTALEAIAQYRKIKNYNTRKNMLDWRNNILFIGDDEDGNLHMGQANELAEWVSNSYPQFAIKKVFMDAYKQESSSLGARYPEVKRAIIDNIQKGIMIYNYTGHGGELGITDEQILMKGDLLQLSNAGNLPLFVTATCKFTRFDDLTIDSNGDLSELTSAGEVSLLNENGGNIALLSTTRIVYSSENFELNKYFFKVVFQKDSNGHYYRLGDIIRMTKNYTGIQRNKLSFGLFGDPALKLAIPEFTVHTDSLNGMAVNDIIDTLSAFSRVKISGHIEDTGHNLASTYNGTIYPSVFDKRRTVTSLANDGGTPFQYSTQENLLFKGKASVYNGQFSFEFLVPKDITYTFEKGKILYYSQDARIDANGYFNRFIIGGTSSSFFPDKEGPDIFLYLNDDNFSDKGISNADPVIFAQINDTSGINITGNGIGHDITGVLDNDESKPIILNDFFETELNDFTRGQLIYPMSNLSEGWHTLKVKAWDVLNNSSIKTIQFKVIVDTEPVLSNFYNYPNPASQSTWFHFEHNRPGEELRVTINIYDMAGRNVAVIHQSVNTTGFSIDPIEWDLKGENGNRLNIGIYPYRIRITDSKGNFAESFNKLLINGYY